MVAESFIDRPPASTVLAARAPAKLNLALAVHGRRPDGFHRLTSLVLAVELFDDLEFESTATPAISLECTPASLSNGPDNLVVRAAQALAEASGTPMGVRIGLQKRIPLSSGLGGGSSDAAMTLAALNELWGLKRSAGELARLGASLGSDVPLFFALPSALITGRGEHVAPVRLAWSGWVVLAFGEWPVSTRETYGRWKTADHREGSEEDIGSLAAVRRAADLTPRLFNELEAAVYRTVPAVEAYHRRLREATGHGWRLTGAGATAFALFDGEAEARAAATELERHRLADSCAVVRTADGAMEDFLRRDDRWRFPKPGSS